MTRALPQGSFRTPSRQPGLGLSRVTRQRLTLGWPHRCEAPELVLMAKAKAKSNGSVQNKSIYSRASYLYQAASYLASRAHDAQGTSSGDRSSHEEKKNQQQQHLQQQRANQLLSLSRRALADMRAVTLKAQIRQSQALKRSVCKACDTLLVEGRTCRSVIENGSKAGRKPWADVLVVCCATCGHAKRFPVAPLPRQKRIALRPPTALAATATATIRAIANTTSEKSASDARAADQDVPLPARTAARDFGRETGGFSRISADG